MPTRSVPSGSGMHSQEVVELRARAASGRLDEVRVAEVAQVAETVRKQPPRVIPVATNRPGGLTRSVDPPSDIGNGLEHGRVLEEARQAERLRQVVDPHVNEVEVRHGEDVVEMREALGILDEHAGQLLLVRGDELRLEVVR